VSALTPSAVMALALQCVGPSLAPVMVGIAQHESGLDPTIVHHNPNGTVDVGLAQVNSANFGWLGLTMQTAMDPCRNLAAGARVLLVRYNGNPSDVGKIAYASAVTARIRALDGDGAVTVGEVPAACPPDDPSGWHVVAIPTRCRAKTAWHTTPHEKDGP
jgi:Transglycosylase SLT domain